MYMKVRDRIYKLHILIGCAIFCKLQDKLQKITTINRYYILEIKINYFIMNNMKYILMHIAKKLHSH